MNIVSVLWLKENLCHKNLIIFDATIPKVTNLHSKKNSYKKQIKNARFFDIKKVFSKQNAPFPNTLLSPKKFEEETQKLGVNKNSIIVVYDDLGIYSSARVWWMFKAMGHKNIAVLDGGLPAWFEAAYPTEKKSKERKNGVKGNFKSNYNSTFFCSKNIVLKSILNKEKQIIDARSKNRFYGTNLEPRENIRSGHIPSSKNLPYTKLLQKGKLKPIKKLKQKFKNINTEKKPLIFSCGSGITACILALVATIIGYTNLTVYDGSWTEWGSLPELPIEK